MDRNWIKPPNIIVRKGKKNDPQKLSYWIDEKGKVQLYTKEELATVNILTNINLLLVQALVLMDKLKTMDKNAKVKSLVHQNPDKFKATESSIFNQFVKLMAATPDITFGEFLGFISGSNNPQELAKMGEKPKFDIFYSSDKLKER